MMALLTRDCARYRRATEGAKRRRAVRLSPSVESIYQLAVEALRLLAVDSVKWDNYFCGPKISRNARSRSSSARTQSPLKLEPCMMASVAGSRSASFLRFCAVSGVYGI